MWPKELIRAEPAGATPTQGNTPSTPLIQFPSFGLGNHRGCEEGPTVPVANHATPMDPLDDDMQDANPDQYLNSCYDDGQPDDFDHNLDNMEHPTIQCKKSLFGKCSLEDTPPDAYTQDKAAQ